MIQEQINKKIFKSLDILASITDHYKTLGKKIIVTNGVFDLLHPGHVYNLAECKEEGDTLVVIVNGQSSATNYKGPGRPFIAEKDRLMMVASLQFVDFVLVWNETTSLTTPLSRIKPDIWAKGSDRTLETLDQDERKIVEDNNGKIVFIPLKDGYSTTLLIEKIKQS
jgi:rfaE bifunctional protein nucleotidyltransferase chain/domain